MSDLFVSWTGDHAKRIGELIRSLFDQFRDTFQVFLSSRDIQEGTEWQDSLLNNLHNAGDGVVIFGQEAIKSDWLIHESAVLSSRTSKRLTVFRTRSAGGNAARAAPAISACVTHSRSHWDGGSTA